MKAMGAPEKVPGFGIFGELVENEAFEDRKGAVGFGVAEEGAGRVESFIGGLGAESGIEGFEEVEAGFLRTVKGVVATASV